MRQLSRWPLSDGSCDKMTLGVENIVYAGMDGEEALG